MANRRPAAKRARRRTRGQGLVEFALVLPIFLLMVFGLIDGARFVYTNSVLSQAAREGARLGSVEAGWIGSSDASCGKTGGPVCPASVTALRNDVLAAANRMVSPFGTITSTELFLSCDANGNAPISATWTGTTCTNNTPNNVVSVRVVLGFTPITPILGQLFGTSLSGSATMVIN